MGFRPSRRYRTPPASDLSMMLHAADVLEDVPSADADRAGRAIRIRNCCAHMAHIVDVAGEDETVGAGCERPVNHTRNGQGGCGSHSCHGVQVENGGVSSLCRDLSRLGSRQVGQSGVVGRQGRRLIGEIRGCHVDAGRGHNHIRGGESGVGSRHGGVGRGQRGVRRGESRIRSSHSRSRRLSSNRSRNSCCSRCQCSVELNRHRCAGRADLEGQLTCKSVTSRSDCVNQGRRGRSGGRREHRNQGNVGGGPGQGRASRHAREQSAVPGPVDVGPADRNHGAVGQGHVARRGVGGSCQNTMVARSDGVAGAGVDGELIDRTCAPLNDAPHVGTGGRLAALQAGRNERTALVLPNQVLRAEHDGRQLRMALILTQTGKVGRRIRNRQPGLQGLRELQVRGRLADTVLPEQFAGVLVVEINWHEISPATYLLVA